MTLEEAVGEVLVQLTGLDLSYAPELNRFRAITQHLNRALRHVALEQEWGYFSSVEEVGTATAGLQDVELNPKLRARIIGDDAIRLNDTKGITRAWAYFLPRDAIHKYAGWKKLYAAVTRTTITFSREFQPAEDGLRIMVPVMREPRMFRLPEVGAPVSNAVLKQQIDFDYPDLVIARAMYTYASADPVMQPRVQTLEENYKDIMYQLQARDEMHTDSPYMNEFLVPIQADAHGSSYLNFSHPHPHADGRF